MSCFCRRNSIEMSLFLCYDFIEMSFTGVVSMLYRKIESLIEAHLKSSTQKILLIDGARQVGKTYIIRHVGKRLFENFIEINLV